ncbi:Kinesin-like protein KIN-6 [Linum grandiflorum]
MDSISSPQCPYTLTVRRNPPRRARPTPMKDPAPVNMEELLPNPQPDPPSSATSQAPAPDSLKVFLRIKPVVSANAIPASKLPGASKSRAKNVWPQNPTAKKNFTKEKPIKKSISEVCISVNDCQSVTISPPPSLVDSKKIRSEVYEGFSHVFAPDSLQSEVYDKMVKPMVDDFLQGRNGMLAALGPSGSGKTHTVFGTPREPGMVPLALQHIFQQSKGSDPNLSRSFFLSIFEIYSEKGKGERICDLIPERVQSGLHTSIKGVQEARSLIHVTIPNASKAESLIACAMLKRATSMTNTNSQSSRSQCIINVRMLVEKQDGELGDQPCDVMLTIVDLAGAEREKRTGNQGAKLLESNFINNTSMVFGLCLRALLEHQKNPKKQLQMHFQNSMVMLQSDGLLASLMGGLSNQVSTRISRRQEADEFVQILTVKPGEEDYLDTAYLLRQASPYMKIKFDNLGDTSGYVRKRRPLQFTSKIGQDKRLKSSDVDIQPEERKAKEPENITLQEAPTNEASTVDNSDSVITSPIHFNPTGSLTTDRIHTITQNFAKAIWSVLKQYKERLVLAEREVQNVSENIINERARRIELEMELLDLKSRCACFKKNTVEANLTKVNTKTEVHENLADNDADETQGVLKSNSGDSSRIEPFSEQIQQDVDVFSEINSNTGPTSGADETCSSRWELDINVVEEEEFIEDQVPSTSGELGNDKVEPVDIQSVVHGEESVNLQLSPARYDENEQSSVQATSFIENQVGSTSGDPRSNRAECLDLTEELQSVVHAEEHIDLQPSSAHYEENEQRSVQATSVVEKVKVRSTSGDPTNSRTESLDPTDELVDIQSVVHGEEYVGLEPCPAHYEENEQSSVQAASVIEDQAQSTSRDPRNNRLECLDLTEELVGIQSVLHGKEHVDLQESPAPFEENEKGSVQATTVAVFAGSQSTMDLERHQSSCLEELQGPSDPAESKEDDVRCTQDSNSEEPKAKTKSVPPLKASKPEKPKRRLLPASSSLLRDITSLAINDEPEKPKRGKGGKKLGVDETKRTQGNKSLLRLLQSNIDHYYTPV